jgi:tetratricopeptide (TPR) repeat protein
MALISDDAPADFDAAFALGASQLRTAFNADESGQCNALRKQAQAQLLQAAKLNSSHPGPFALLGICYEEGEDIRRAIGCYVKALQLDPAHPVAGRGLLRLQSHEKVAKMIEVATNANSALNGWAWRSTGQHKATIEGDDELAVVALRKALRCSDIIEAPNDENLGAFFSKPFSQSKPSDYGYVWAELAACYRRLGRYTSAIRAYQAAYESAGESLSSWILCSWAQGKRP